MATIRKSDEPAPKRKAPATTLEGRENQLVSLAVDLVEKQLLEGTASSQVITHYLKLGTTRERLEQSKLASENALLKAKIDELGTRQKSEEMYAKAMRAFSTYAGHDVVDEDESYD